MANTFVPIQSVTLTGSQTSVVFSSIPATYTDLVLRVTARQTYTGVYNNWITVRFNGDATTKYSFTYLYGFGTTIGSARGTQGDGYTSSYPFYVDASSSTANTFGSGEIYIPNYTAATHKPISSFGVSEINSASDNYLAVVANLYSQTTAISSMTIGINGATSLDAGSTFHLYGIKNS